MRFAIDSNYVNVYWHEDVWGRVGEREDGTMVRFSVPFDARLAQTCFDSVFPFPSESRIFTACTFGILPYTDTVS